MGHPSLPHRARAALRAISFRLLGDSLLARASPRLRAAGLGPTGDLSSTSCVASAPIRCAS